MNPTHADHSDLKRAHDVARMMIALQFGALSNEMQGRIQVLRKGGSNIFDVGLPM